MQAFKIVDRWSSSLPQESHDFKTPFGKGHELRKKKKAQRRNQKAGKKTSRKK